VTSPQRLQHPAPSRAHHSGAAGNSSEAAAAPLAAPGSRKTLQLAELLGNAQGIDIDHNGLVYRLQITKAGKLILTK
jgi:hemin uptake protein HemP